MLPLGATYGTVCPSTSVCIAVGSDGGATAEIFRSTDGGVDWSDVVIPTGLSRLVGVTCMSSTACLAVGFISGSSTDTPEVLASANGGQSWALQTLPISNGDLIAVSCVASTTDCTVVGNVSGNDAPAVILGTTDGGTTWTSQSAPSDAGPLSGVSCVSATTCQAVGETYPEVTYLAIDTTDGGSTWNDETLPSPPGVLSGLDSISCTSSMDCVAGGFDFNSSNDVALMAMTTDGGTTWSNPPMPAGTLAIGGVSCPTSTACEVATTYLAPPENTQTAESLRSTDGGATWTAQQINAYQQGGMTSISCSSATVCIGSLQSADLITNDGGAVWRGVPLPSNDHEISGVACGSASSCVGVGNYDHATASAGVAWVTTAISASPQDTTLFSAACPTAAICLSAGSVTTSGKTSGTAYSTANAGTTWTHLSLSFGSGDSVANAVSCASASTCEIVGYRDAAAKDTPLAYRTTDGGAKWTAQKLPTAISDPQGVACATTSDCVIVGFHQTSATSGTGVALRTTDAGKKWSAIRFDSSIGVPTAVSCPTATSCVLVGGKKVYLGAKTGYAGAATSALSTNGGKTWISKHVAAKGDAVLQGVSCLASLRCEAVGGTSVAVNGSLTGLAFGLAGKSGAWTAQALPANTGDLAATAHAASSGWVASGESTSLTGLLLSLS